MRGRRWAPASHSRAGRRPDRRGRVNSRHTVWRGAGRVWVPASFMPVPGLFSGSEKRQLGAWPRASAYYCSGPDGARTRSAALHPGHRLGNMVRPVRPLPHGGLNNPDEPPMNPEEEGMQTQTVDPSISRTPIRLNATDQATVCVCCAAITAACGSMWLTDTLSISGPMRQTRFSHGYICNKGLQHSRLCEPRPARLASAQASARGRL